MTKIALFLFVAAGIFLFLAVVELVRAKTNTARINEYVAEKYGEFSRERATLDKMHEELQDEARRLNMDAATPVRATYFTSESDLLKYADEKKLAKAVKKALCTQLADSMMKIAEPHKVRLDDGRDMYLLQYRVKEEL